MSGFKELCVVKLREESVVLAHRGLDGLIVFFEMHVTGVTSFNLT